MSANEQRYAGISHASQGGRSLLTKAAILLRCRLVLIFKLPRCFNQATDVAKKIKNQQPDLRNAG